MNTDRGSRLFLAAGLCAAVLGLLAFAPAARAADPPKPQWQPPPAEPVYILRVAVHSREDVQRLTTGHWDVLEARGPDYLLVMGGDPTVMSLRDAGFTVTLDHEVTIPAWFTPDTYYGGYRTVVEHYAHLDSVLSTYPNLTVGYTYGQSWVVTNPGTYPSQFQPPGYPLRAICITNLQAGDCQLTPSPYPNPPKPRFFLMAAIHARELTTSEMAWRWIDYLTQNYGVDPDVTMLLDSYEMWVVPVINPDGRWFVELGGSAPYYQRKNADNANGGTSCPLPPQEGSQPGVDMNRNANFGWGYDGTSTFVCDQEYLGTAAASEPETQAVQTLIGDLFPDEKGPNYSDPAPPDTNGAMITLHTFSNQVILPWGCQTCPGIPVHTPNDAGLRHFAWRLAYFLQDSQIPPPSGWPTYEVGQSWEILYPVSGATDDYTYGTLGTPGFTYEMGPGPNGTCGDFLPTYDCQDGNTGFPGGFWGIARPSFVYAAKNSRTAYMTTLGPDAVVPNPNVFCAVQGDQFTLNVTIDDHTFGSDPISPTPPAVNNVTAAECFVDTPPWAGGTPIPMAAVDGTFDQPTEAVTATIDTTSLSLGRHTIYFQGQNATGNWGAATAVWLNVGTALADLSVTQVANPTGNVCAGATITYTVSTANLGPGTADSLTLTDALPSGATNVNVSTSGWNCTGTGTLTCTLPSLAMGNAPDIVITLLPGTSPAVNAVSISSATADCVTANNVSTVSSTIVPVPAAPIPSSNSPVCEGGTLTLTCNPVTGQIHWTGPNGYSVFGRTQTISNVTLAMAGDYFVTTTVNGCTSPAGSTTVVVNPRPAAVASGNASICPGGTTALSGSGGVSCSWAPTAGLDNPNSCTPNATPTVTTAYALTVTDANGCVSNNAPTATVTIVPNPAPAISVTRCLTPNTSGLQASVAANAGDTYNWTITGGTIDSGQGTDTVSFTSGGPAALMTLSLTETTTIGCSGSTSQTMQVNFNDVPSSNPFYTFVCKLARNAVTAGCGSGNFCPANNVLRSQMAVFVLRGKHGSTYVPPPAVGIFSDVLASNPFAPWIEELYNEQITGGCSTNPLMYCPSNSVSRAGMAVFLLVAKHGTGYTPPACTGIFTDVACPSAFANWIEELYNEGITGGCSTNPLQYCPSNAVIRAQMAVFLTATFNLP